MSYTEQFTETHAVLAELAPSAANAVIGAHNSAWVSTAMYNRLFALIHAGEPTGATTLDMTVQQATTVGGAGPAKAITPQPAGAGTKSITQLAAGDAGSYCGIEIRTEEMDVDGRFSFVRLVVTVGAAGVYYYSAFLFGLEPRYAQVGVTGWQEIIA